LEFLSVVISYQSLFEQELVIENGEIVLSNAPGLGLDFSEAALVRLAL